MSEEQKNKIESEILQAVREVKYGSVEIIIHNSEVVQIERKTKVRFGKSEKSSS